MKALIHDDLTPTGEYEQQRETYRREIIELKQQAELPVEGKTERII